MAFRTVDCLSRQAEEIGFVPDEKRTALYLANMDDPATLAVLGEIKCYRFPAAERVDGTVGDPEYLAIIEEKREGKYSGRDFGRGRRRLTVHAGGAIVLYDDAGEKQYQGFFGKGGKPLEEHGRVIQKRLFG